MFRPARPGTEYQRVLLHETMRLPVTDVVEHSKVDIEHCLNWRRFPGRSFRETGYLFQEAGSPERVRQTEQVDMREAGPMGLKVHSDLEQPRRPSWKIKQMISVRGGELQFRNAHIIPSVIV